MRLRLVPEEIVGGQSLQLQLGAMSATPTLPSAGRAMVRIQGPLDPDAVLTAVLDGGRGPGERGWLALGRTTATGHRSTRADLPARSSSSSASKLGESGT
ncbi:hypothetical protein [Amycolatopsis kentuckyensis]|uniref:hypothetical protein n=1 Tax=Amycolatopsis kentuckyensis TaxID=218823 RepID=UPI001ABF7479